MSKFPVGALLVSKHNRYDTRIVVRVDGNIYWVVRDVDETPWDIGKWYAETEYRLATKLEKALK